MANDIEIPCAARRSHRRFVPQAGRDSQVLGGVLQAAPLAFALWIGLASMIHLVI